MYEFAQVAILSGFQGVVWAQGLGCQWVNTAFYIASKNLAFSKFKGLCELQEKNGLDFRSQYKNNKACRDFA